jgi:HAD superfamily hydrolase (TIGR01549 family)
MRIRALLLDFGDTLADQATEERDEAGLMIGVELFPGARELLTALRGRGLPVGLVVDGEADENRIARVRLGLDGLFDALAISSEVGVSKPDPRIYVRALDELGVAKEDYGRVVMVGNRLERDVRGSRALGLVTVWLDRSPRYRKQPLDVSEVPDYVIGGPLELLAVLDRLEAG